MTEITIQLKDAYAVISSIKDDGTQEEKIVDNLALKRALASVEAESIADTPLLPGEYGTQRISSVGTNTRILYLEPASLRRISYHGNNEPSYTPSFFRDDEWDIRGRNEDESESDYQRFCRSEFRTFQQNYINEHGRYLYKYDIVMPRMLWLLDVRETTRGLDVHRSELFAMKESVFTGNEQIYNYPTGNVYNDNRVCWGNNTVRLPSMKAIQSLSNLFFSSPFNHDLIRGRFSSFGEERYVSDFHELAVYHTEELSAGSKPEDLLDQLEQNMHPAGITFNQMMNR